MGKAQREFSFSFGGGHLQGVTAQPNNAVIPDGQITDTDKKRNIICSRVLAMVRQWCGEGQLGPRFLNWDLVAVGLIGHWMNSRFWGTDASELGSIAIDTSIPGIKDNEGIEQRLGKEGRIILIGRKLLTTCRCTHTSGTNDGRHANRGFQLEEGLDADVGRDDWLLSPAKRVHGTPQP